MDARAYNRKLKELLPCIQTSLKGSRIFYADIYKPIMDMIKSPEKQGMLNLIFVFRLTKTYDSL